MTNTFRPNLNTTENLAIFSRDLESRFSGSQKILSDEIILSELSKNIDRLSTNKKDDKMYLNAKRHRAYRLLMHGYYMDARSKLANLLKR